MMDPSGAVVSVQQGVFRTNCIDCLDRTNVVQSMLARRSLQAQLEVYTYFMMHTAIKNGRGVICNCSYVMMFSSKLCTIMLQSFVCVKLAILTFRGSIFAILSLQIAEQANLIGLYVNSSISTPGKCPPRYLVYTVHCSGFLYTCTLI